MANPPRLRFTAADVDLAFETWGCNCGPAAIAAILGLTLDEVRRHMGDFEVRRYTNPTLMGESLRGAGARFDLRQHPAWQKAQGPSMPNWGLARIQWEGPWMHDGVPVAARYQRTHWVGTYRPQASGFVELGVFDINAIDGGGWLSFETWRDRLVPRILRQGVPRADGGWHVTHAYEVQR